jgi:uroporphyrinogen decarboxylase
MFVSKAQKVPASAALPLLMKAGISAQTPALGGPTPESSFLNINKKSLKMHGQDKPFLAVLRGERRDPPPVWLMRQAGRYLPEYKATRAQAGDFLSLCYNPDLAAEVTLQPIRRYDFDAAILFSDILVIPQALGQTLWFEAGEGPRLAPKIDAQTLDTLIANPDQLNPIYETVRRVVAQLPAHTAMIGFAGAPWTIATYMIHGQGSRDHGDARLLTYRDPGLFQALIDRIVAATVAYLGQQIEAGVEVVKLFDSWAGALAPAQFERWVIAPNAAIVGQLKARYPHVPIIGFPRGAATLLPAYAAAVPVDAVAVDENVDLAWVHKALPPRLPLQGNLDPAVLVAGGAPLQDAVLRIRAALADRPHIFNLGHGIWQTTPPEHVTALLTTLRQEMA